MTEVTDKPTLQLNDKNYIIEDLSDQARYIVAPVSYTHLTLPTNREV